MDVSRWGDFRFQIADFGSGPKACCSHAQADGTLSHPHPPVLQPDGREGRTRGLCPTAAPLRETLRWWDWGSGLRSLAREIGSCYQRIRLTRKNKWGDGLLFDRVCQSLPPLPECGDLAGTQSCIAGIQKLEESRPYLTTADVELFLQGWFQAERSFRRTQDREGNRTGCGSSG